MKVVRITWLDAVHQEDDATEEEARELKPLAMTSYGVLLVDDEERVVIASHVGEVASRPRRVIYRDTLCIPRRAVVRIDEMGETQDASGTQ